jgi:hypothetical protein
MSRTDANARSQILIVNQDQIKSARTHAQRIRIVTIVKNQRHKESENVEILVESHTNRIDNRIDKHYSSGAKKQIVQNKIVRDRSGTTNQIVHDS